MFYIEKDNQIVIYDTNKQRLEKTLTTFLPQLKGLKIQETNRPIINGEFADTKEYLEEQAKKEREALIQKLYEIKAAKAYGGVIIDNSYVFETNQTSITNTVASLALMQDDDTRNWKFYTLDGQPVFHQITKAQLIHIADFGQKMIDKCFEVEGNFNEQLKEATIEQLNDKEWVEGFLQEAKDAMDEVNNKIQLTPIPDETETKEDASDSDNTTVEETPEAENLTEKAVMNAEPQTIKRKRANND